QRIIEEAKAGLESKGVIKEQWTVEMPRVLGEDEAVALLKQRVHVQVEAFAIQVDGKPVVFLPTEADAREVLEKARQRFCPEGVELLAKPEFREQVRIVQAVVDPAAVCRTQDEALKLLLGGGDRYYTVQAGDYPAKIAEKFGLTLKQFYALNPGKKGKDLRAGEKVLVARTKPRLTVVTVRKITVRKPIEPPEEVSPTPSLPAGERRVVTEGEPGEKLLVLKAVYENDQRVKAQVLESRVLKPPKPRKVMEGTGTAPQTPASPAGQARQ
ncbi:MAG: G5 domain-containing protein, partial [Armatimonadetes bacterium]|nr:G5 domain-containing protein [Armatimonadota bacterium]